MILAVPSRSRAENKTILSSAVKSPPISPATFTLSKRSALNEASPIRVALSVVMALATAKVAPSFTTRIASVVGKNDAPPAVTCAVPSTSPELNAVSNPAILSCAANSPLTSRLSSDGAASVEFPKRAALNNESSVPMERSEPSPMLRTRTLVFTPSPVPLSKSAPSTRSRTFTEPRIPLNTTPPPEMFAAGAVSDFSPASSAPVIAPIFTRPSPCAPR